MFKRFVKLKSLFQINQRLLTQAFRKAEIPISNKSKIARSCFFLRYTYLLFHNNAKRFTKLKSLHVGRCLSTFVTSTATLDLVAAILLNYW